LQSGAPGALQPPPVEPHSQPVPVQLSMAAQAEPSAEQMHPLPPQSGASESWQASPVGLLSPTHSHRPMPTLQDSSLSQTESESHSQPLAPPQSGLGLPEGQAGPFTGLVPPQVHSPAEQPSSESQVEPASQTQEPPTQFGL